MAERKLTYNIKKAVDEDALRAQRLGVTTDPVGTPGNPSSQKFTVANVITFCRLLLTVLFLVLFVTQEDRMAALVCYATAAATDFLDGQVARRTQTVSWVGKIMDPVMDRVLLFTGVLGLMVVGELPVWVAVFVIGRDAYLFVGSLVLQKYRKRPVDVIYCGKAATACFMVGFCDLLLGAPRVAGLGVAAVDWLPGLNFSPAPVGIFVVYVAVVLSFITAVIYTWEGVQIKKEALAARKAEQDA